MKPTICVDTWFIFGNFVYGFEGYAKISATAKLEINLSNQDNINFNEFFDFFDELTSCPKGLVSSEIRIVEIKHESSLQRKQILEQPICLVTELSPTISSHSESDLTLIFNELRGKTEQDATAFKELSDAWLALF